MARRRSRKTAKKVQPMELDMYFDLPVVSGGVMFIDIAQCQSIMNRKFIRQQQQFAVQEVELVSNGTTVLSVSRLPNTWVVSNALEKAYHVWQKSQHQVLDETPSIAGAYRDFKVFLNEYHADSNGSLNLLPSTGMDDPTTAAGSQAYLHDVPHIGSTRYDWEYSDIRIPNDGGAGVTVGYKMHILGPDGASKGIIEGYANSRSRPQTSDPNTPFSVDSWFVDAFDVGDNLPDIRDDLATEGDAPPYVTGETDNAVEYYPGGSTNAWGPTLECKLQTVGSQMRSMGSAYSGGFLANAGLLQINWDTDATAVLKITLAPGHSRGLMSRDVKKVN